jgi:hypothetical protein
MPLVNIYGLADGIGIRGGWISQGCIILKNEDVNYYILRIIN